MCAVRSEVLYAHARHLTDCHSQLSSACANDSRSFREIKLLLRGLSQCSTVVRNTVLRATMRVNGKPPILGTRSPLTPQSIELKFDTDDYVGGATPHAKNGKSRRRRAGPVNG